MPEIILDYKASQPSNQTGGTPAFPLPVSPALGIQLADLGIFMMPPIPTINRIELKGTVGLQAVSGTPVVEFQLTRQPDGVGPEIEIFNKRFTLEPAPAEGFYTASFHTIDFNADAASGFIVYRLRGRVLDVPVGVVNVVGPITFTGIAVGNID
jgi:hypothetical protein